MSDRVMLVSIYGYNLLDLTACDFPMGILTARWGIRQGFQDWGSLVQRMRNLQRPDPAGPATAGSGAGECRQVHAELGTPTTKQTSPAATPTLCPRP